MKTLGTLLLVFVLALTGSATADEGLKPGTFSSTDNHAFSCKKTLSDRLQFASADRASTILGKKDGWARQLSAFDLGIRQKTAHPTSLHEFLDFASEAALEWTPEERASWGAVIDKLSRAMEGLGVDLPNIDLVKTTGKEEFNAAYTRQQAIMFPQALATGLAATQPRVAFFLLAHELFHVLSRHDSDLRDKTYALLGANRFDGIELPAELEERRVSNPDAHTYEHAVTVQTASRSANVVPVIQALVPLEEAITLPNFFAALDITLLAVDTSTRKVLRHSNGTLITYTFGNTNWVTLMRRNSDFIIQPEEVLADNFATLMEWRANGVLPVTNAAGFTVNDVHLLVSIEKILADGCGK